MQFLVGPAAGDSADAGRLGGTWPRGGIRSSGAGHELCSIDLSVLNRQDRCVFASPSVASPLDTANP
jgi:hypothetical protein